MGIFSKDAISDEAKSSDRDTVGSSYGLLDTDIYPCTINMAHIVETNSGALMFHIAYETEDGVKGNFSTCIQSGAGKTYFVNKDKEKQELPGFALLRTMLYIAEAEYGVEDLDTEERVWPVYDYDEKKEIDTDVDAVADLIDVKMYLAIQKQSVNKKEKDDDGNYVDTNERREQNEVVKVFEHPTKLSVQEIEADVEEAQFFDVWIEKFQGKVIDRFKEVKDGSGKGSTTRRRPGRRNESGSTDDDAGDDEGSTSKRSSGKRRRSFGKK